jgi:hypothetical protein
VFSIIATNVGVTGVVDGNGTVEVKVGRSNAGPRGAVHTCLAFGYTINTAINRTNTPPMIRLRTYLGFDIEFVPGINMILLRKLTLKSNFQSFSGDRKDYITVGGNHLYMEDSYSLLGLFFFSVVEEP